MIYPKFLCKGDIIGVTAPSDGKVDKIDLVRLDNAYSKLESKGYSIMETLNVRKSINGRSSSAKERALQLEELFKNNDIKVIVSANGGEFLIEILPYIDFRIIKNNPKWFCGYSDNTGISFVITTMLDIASIYSDNIASFGMNRWHSSINNYLNILEGNINEQKSYNKYQDGYNKYVTGLEGYNLTKDVYWKNIPNIDINISGRFIGGCLDILLSLVGTKYDCVDKFINKYKDDGIIWYLESCDLNCEGVVRGLWQLKEAGWFKYVKGFIFGRPATKSSVYDISYEDSVMSVLKELKVPVILDADFGHIPPRMTLINGSYVEITSCNGKGSINTILK